MILTSLNSIHEEQTESQGECVPHRQPGQCPGMGEFLPRSDRGRAEMTGYVRSVGHGLPYLTGKSIIPPCGFATIGMYNPRKRSRTGLTPERPLSLPRKTNQHSHAWETAQWES